MISVIIPFMDVMHYGKCLKRCVDSLNKQTADLEIIVSEHKPEKFIRKNYLLNKGFEKAKFDIIWHCDADFTLKDKTMLDRMAARLKEVIYPVFYSRVHNKYKIADGGPLIRKDTLKRHGYLDESLLGISLVTFPLLSWCIKNAEFEVCQDFIVNHFHKISAKKVHSKTRSKLKKLYSNLVNSNEFMFDLRQ